MSIKKRIKPSNFHGKTILWVTTTLMEIALDKTTLIEIIRHLEERKHNLHLITTRSRKFAPFLIEKSQLHVIFIPLRYVPFITPIMHAILLSLLLPYYVITLKPDFIITNPSPSILSFIPTVILSKLKRVKLILDVRSTPVETTGLKGYLENFWFMISIRLAKRVFNGITIITSMMKEKICNDFDIDCHNIGVWTSGVSIELFNRTICISESPRLRKKFGLTKKFVVFYHGVFTATRGLDATIESIKVLRSIYPDVVLFLLGSGPMAPALKDLVQKERLQENVIIHDSVDYEDVPKFIALSDVCIVPLPDHPYWRFQCPLKLLEYLAMEKVVILTDIPSHRTIIGEEKCGIYISLVNPFEIAKSIVFAYDNKDKLLKWGKSGRIIVEEKYKWQKVSEDLENYLFSIDSKVD